MEMGSKADFSSVEVLILVGKRRKIPFWVRNQQTIYRGLLPPVKTQKWVSKVRGRAGKFPILDGQAHRLQTDFSTLVESAVTARRTSGAQPLPAEGISAYVADLGTSCHPTRWCICGPSTYLLKINVLCMPISILQDEEMLFHQQECKCHHRNNTCSWTIINFDQLSSELSLWHGKARLNNPRGSGDSCSKPTYFMHFMTISTVYWFLNRTHSTFEVSRSTIRF